MAGRDARHSRRAGGSRLVAWGPVVVVLLLLAAAFASFEYDVGRRLGVAAPTDPVEVEPPAGLELPELAAAAPVADPLARATPVDRARVRRALAPFRKDPDLGRHTVIAVGAPDGTVLVDSSAGPVVPASTMKLLTAVAVLDALGPDHRFVTTVVRPAPGRVVLVGGGDPYLERTQARYADDPPTADLRTLARRTATALRSDGTTRVRLDFDDSLFTGPVASPHWRESYLPDEVVSPITALMVDEGREDPGSGFEDEPSLATAREFARQLERAGVEVRGDPRRREAGGAPELARVEGMPVWQAVEHVIAVSDNEGAEVLAHHVGLAEGFGGSFAGGAKGMRAVLRRLGIPLQDAVIRDGSGLSRRNRLTADTLLAVLAEAATGDPALRSTITGLPVAGFTGSLAARFDDVPDAGPGRVRAKTGTLTGVHGLAGLTTDLDGNVLTFVLVADKVKLDDQLDARATLEDLASALADCHCS